MSSSQVVNMLDSQLAAATKVPIFETNDADVLAFKRVSSLESDVVAVLVPECKSVLLVEPPRAKAYLLLLLWHSEGVLTEDADGVHLVHKTIDFGTDSNWLRFTTAVLFDYDAANFFSI